MKINQSLVNYVEESVYQEKLEKILEQDFNFNSVTSELGLDPETDFQHSNLSGVDFSGSDLRWHNFFGADLTGAFGVDVLFDSTTLLVNADLERSLFSKWVREAKVFQSNNSAERLYRLMKGADYEEITKWLSGRFLNGEDNHRRLKYLSLFESKILSQKLITDDIDLSKRTSLMYYLKDLSSSENDYVELVLDITARHSENEELVKALINSEGVLQRNDEVINECFCRLSVSGGEKVRWMALKALVRSNISITNPKFLQDQFFSHVNYKNRRREIYSAAATLGKKYLSVITSELNDDDISETSSFDWLELIDGKSADKAARNLAIREKVANGRYAVQSNDEELDKGNEFHPSNIHKISATDEEVEAKLRFARERQLEVLASNGFLSFFFEKHDSKLFEESSARLKHEIWLDEKQLQQKVAASYRGLAP